MKLKTQIRETILAAGELLPDSILRRTGNYIRELELRRWLKSHGLFPEKVVARREELFEMVGAEVGEKPALYLEFGVAEGDATRYWAKLLKHPETLLHGFDCFEGLPETWSEDRPKGMFSTGGRVPDINDSRVKFFKGLFDQTLPAYEIPQREAVIINIDADLYSSTIYVLRKLAPLFRAGTYLYFDEFSFFGHEERAFREFVGETGLKFKLRGGNRGLLYALFQCAGPANKH